MADMTITLRYEGAIHKDKSENQLVATIAAALAGKATNTPQVFLASPQLILSFTASDEYTIATIRAFAKTMVASDFTSSSVRAEFML